MTAHDFARAARFSRRATILDAASVPARRGLANALLRLNEPGNALRWAKAAAALASRDPMVQTTLGEALFANGDKEGARAAWTEADLLGYPDAKRRLERLEKP
jgi:Flp pilus assembly protein TadD